MAGRHLRWSLLAVAVAVTCLAGSAAAPVWAGPAPRVLLVGSYHGIAGQFRSIRAALAAARAGDWILVGPGDYKAASYGDGSAGSGGTPAPAGAFITTAGIHLRGMNRNAVVIDGTRPGSPPCSPRRADQVRSSNFARNGGFANPTNGDVALYTTPSTDLAPPHHVYGADCFAGNTDPAGFTSDPQAVQSDPLYGCGRPTPGNPDPVLVVQAECAAQLLAPCPAVPGLRYPRPGPSFPLPMPGPQPTMPDPCAGVPPNPWCPAGR